MIGIRAYSIDGIAAQIVKLCSRDSGQALAAGASATDHLLPFGMA